MKVSSLCMCLIIFPLVSTCCTEGPVLCKHLDCPKYSLEKKTDIYEERCYETYNWASTTVQVQGGAYQEAETKAFMILFHYISGQNSKHEEIPMAMPVLTKVHYTPKGSFNPTSFTVSFFIAFSYQTDAPAPVDHNIIISKQSKFSVYVMSFGGYLKLKPEIRVKLKKLADALERDGLGGSYYSDYFYSAVYDTPYVLNNRHNEIWFIKK